MTVCLYHTYLLHNWSIIPQQSLESVLLILPSAFLDSSYSSALTTTPVIGISFAYHKTENNLVFTSSYYLYLIHLSSQLVSIQAAAANKHLWELRPILGQLESHLFSCNLALLPVSFPIQITRSVLAGSPSQHCLTFFFGADRPFWMPLKFSQLFDLFVFGFNLQSRALMQTPRARCLCEVAAVACIVFKD